MDPHSFNRINAPYSKETKMPKKWLHNGKFVLLAGLVWLMLACSLNSGDVKIIVLTPEISASAAPIQPTQAPSTEEAIVQSSVEEEMYTITSVGGAENGPTKPTVFTIDESWQVTEIKTYHWNNGMGMIPGTISLTSDDGITYGPWPATGAEGQGGVVDAYWIVNPQVTIPAGTYTVIDSDTATWAKNDQDTDGMGMSWGRGIRMGNP
jgi:hypothetical protein